MLNRQCHSALALIATLILLNVDNLLSAREYSPIERATVRLVVQKKDCLEYGSGTIVRIDGARATIVSCGHIFESSDQNVKITATLFTDRGQRQVTAQVLAFDESSDVSVITADNVSGVNVIPMAPSGYRPQVGTPVTVAGCDLGGPVSSRPGQVTALNRCAGYENIEVSAVPEDGRSGGGMISPDMKLIGICSGVNPLENEGIYSSITCVHELLNRGPQQTDKATSQAPQAPLPPAAGVLGSNSQPGTRKPRQPLEVVSRTSVPNRSDRAPRLDHVLSGEPATVKARDISQNLSRQQTEVICIVRTLGSADERRVLVVNDASPELLEALTRESAEHRSTSE